MGKNHANMFLVSTIQQEIEKFSGTHIYLCIALLRGNGTLLLSFGACLALHGGLNLGCLFETIGKHPKEKSWEVQKKKGLKNEATRSR